MPVWIFKRANKKYTPLWMYLVQSLLVILEGVISLFLIPFGYTCNFSGYWSAHMIDHAFKIRKAEREK